jgi:hypothetical protein
MLTRTRRSNCRPARVLAALVTAATVAGFAPANARPAHDGDWSVLIVTQQGSCDRAYRYPLRIRDGVVGYGGSSGFTVTGRVNGAGGVTVTVRRGDQFAAGSGRLTATSGSGKWRGASCSGVWTAERRS